MTYPEFNIEYNTVYTSAIKFDTLINEKELGGEQRYPKKIYPVREFTLTFQKNPTGRALFESFFTSLKGSYGLFYFTWSTEKGGNGATYTCQLNKDELKENWKHLGYIESQLKFFCIDRETYSPPTHLPAYHNIELDFESEFATILDKNVTASFEDNRTSLWESPKKSWDLTFQLNPEEAKKLEAFFVSKKGRFHSFYWTWSTEKYGDGSTSLVRFDTDELTSEINYQGYRKIKVPLKETFPTDSSPSNEEYKDEIIPRKLLKIDLPSEPILILDNDTLESLTHNGETYLGAPLEVTEIAKEDNNQAPSVTATISNAGQAISNILGNHGDIITGCQCTLIRVWLNTATNEILTDPAPSIEFFGIANNLKMDCETASIDIECNIPSYSISIPYMTYGTNCQWRKFKDINCGYTGDQKTCDRTQETCKRYGNVENFGGFISLPKEMVIKV